MQVAINILGNSMAFFAIGIHHWIRALADIIYVFVEYAFKWQRMINPVEVEGSSSSPVRLRLRSHSIYYKYDFNQLR